MSLRRRATDRFGLVLILAVCLLFTGNAPAQSTATLLGTIVDATGAAIPNATVTLRNQSTGEERVTQSEATGNYVVPSLPVGAYRVEVKAPGMQTMVATDLPLEVGRTVRQDFSLKIASSTEIIEVSGTAAVIEQSAVSVGSVVDQRTVQEIPLIGDLL